MTDLDHRGARQFFALTAVSIGAMQAPRRFELFAMLAAHTRRHAKRERPGFHAATMGGELPKPAA